MTLIQSLEAPFEPDKYKDEYRENLLALIDAKVKGQEIVAASTPQQKAPVIDILEALKMSLAQAKKPVASVSVKEASTGSVISSEPAPKARKARKS